MTNWFVRIGGADSNGGTSASLTPERQGTDGVANGTTTYVAASGAFTSADVGKGIGLGGASYRITAVTNSTTIVLDKTRSTATGETWKLGGAWASMGNALNRTTSMQANDNVYFGAGVYRDVMITGFSTTTLINYIGDSDGSMTGDPGEAVWTAFTTNDSTAANTSPLMSFSSATGYNKTFTNLTMIGSAAVPKIAVLSSGVRNVTFTNCTFVGAGTSGNDLFSITPSSSGNKAITFDSCRFVQYASSTTAACINATFVTDASANYTTGLVIKNCYFEAMLGINLNTSGALTFKPGGTLIFNNTFRNLGGGSAVRTLTTNWDTTNPNVAENNVIVGAASGFNAAATGQISENYNFILAATPRTLTNTGANSISGTSISPMFEVGQSFAVGQQGRPWGSPRPGSVLSGFGNSSTTGVPAVDAYGYPNPAGGASASKTIGAYVRANTWTRETGTVRTGSNAISITGPGIQDFLVPVDAASTTVTVYVRWDATYAGTKPSMSVLQSAEVGVADATATAVGSSGSWEQLSLTFTPTAKGVVVVRLTSSDTNGGGKAFADDWAVS